MLFTPCLAFSPPRVGRAPSLDGPALFCFLGLWSRLSAAIRIIEVSAISLHGERETTFGVVGPNAFWSHGDW
jgi:hypothetical protein